MTLVRAADDPPPLVLPDRVAGLLRDLIQEKTGIFIEPGRTDWMVERIAPRAAAHGCTSYLDYYYILKYDSKGAEEWRRVMDAFSVQETYFWRELDQIRALVDYAVPAWFGKSSAPLRIWSAACATGEEPYSIAMALNEAGWGSRPIEILASDASEAALVRARAGLYRERSFRALPVELRQKYFERQGEGFVLQPELRSRVRFRWANLVDLAEFLELGTVSVIFCRNVFIYFAPPTIRRVVGSFAQRMPPGGHLFVGASESLVRLTNQFELQELGGAFVYLRQPTR